MKTINFYKILIANRGEISMRIIRAIHELDKLAVVIHSYGDKDLPFVTEADEAHSLGSGELVHTYLNIGKIINIAKEAQVDAIHPGYGFLAENAEFAKTCRQNGFHFIGPDADVISMMGHKANARNIARELGLPTLEGAVKQLEILIRDKARLPYPLLIKPAAGGGGKGIRVISSPETFEQEAREAAREASHNFGSGELYVEHFLEDSRHIEVQVMADHHGNIVHLYDRECSLQRRYQKIIEEAPSAFISHETRERITSIAIELAKGIGYTNAGTIEFLVDKHQEVFFLEMNTRIQVEHPVTEMVTGVDMVKEQITIAEGHPLSFRQEDISITGHSMEARIYAENPENKFLPSTGRIEAFDLPSQDEVRIDSGFRKGNLVEAWYDPLLVKVIVNGRNREDTRKRLIRALKDIRIAGLISNRDFLIELLRSDQFRDNKIHTRLVDQELENLNSSIRNRRNKQEISSLLAAATLITLQNNKKPDGMSKSTWHQIGHWRILSEITLETEHQKYLIKYELLKANEGLKLYMEDKEYQVAIERRSGHNYWIRVNRQVIKVWGFSESSEILLDLDGQLFRFRRMDILDRRYIVSAEQKKSNSPGKVYAPLNGRIVQINVKTGDKVAEGDSLVIIESMKMENKIMSHHDACIDQIEVSVGDLVQTNQIILTLA